MSITLRLEGEKDILNLNEQAEVGVGFQATLGATGLGLPPVTLQWSEGAGDGATYRGERVRSRDIDIPLDLMGRDRDHLKSLVSRLSRVLAKRCRLVIREEGGIEWFADVVRSGGGGFSYGVDTNGERDLQLIVTLTSGDPYFTAMDVSTYQIANATAAPLLGALGSLPVSPSQTMGQVILTNDGDVEAFPVWTVYGPGNNFRAVSPSGEELHWTGSLTVGQWLTIDTQKGTVIDQSGTNRYSELASAPRFWAIPVGVCTAEASLLDTTGNSRILCEWRTRKWMVV